jgi:integrase
MYDVNEQKPLKMPLVAQSLLLPERLAESAATAVREILAEAASANTTRSYASALRYWAAWYLARFGQDLALPVDESVVIQFVVDHLARSAPGGALTWELPHHVDHALVVAKIKAKPGPMLLSSVVHRTAVLSSLHVLKHQTNPCEQPSVRHLLSRARRASVKRGERPTKKTAIARNEMEAMLATCDGSLGGIRDRALLLFGFASGGRRRSEIAAADMSSLSRTGPRSFIYRLMHSKTQQTGPSSDSVPDKPIVDVAADAMEAWLNASFIKEGRLFRRLWGQRVGGPLSPAAIGAIVQRRAKQAGLEGNFGGHSLRSGFVTEAGRQGVALTAVMAMTDHRSIATAARYYQSGAATKNPGARLLAPLKGPGG